MRLWLDKFLFVAIMVPPVIFIILLEYFIINPFNWVWLRNKLHDALQWLANKLD